MINTQELETVAQRMVAKGKGILAADESMGTIKRRFDSIKIESNEENRRAYREMLFTTKGIEEAISGVILFDETLRTKASDGTSTRTRLAFIRSANQSATRVLPVPQAITAVTRSFSLRPVRRSLSASS